MQDMTYSQMLTVAERYSLGLENLFNNMWEMASSQVKTSPNFPPHELIKTGENSWRISMALAGYTKEDVTIEVKENVLTVSSEGVNNKDKGKVIHSGIAYRQFKREFMLGEFVEVKDASLKEGILKIDLVQKLPDHKKPKTININ